MILTQNLVVHSTDDLVTYPDPKTFMDNLPNYVKIESELPEGLGMVSVGQNAPDQQYQDIPWLHLDENNNPLALKYYNGVEWVETQPLQAVTGPYPDMFVQYGQISIRHVQTTRATWVDSMDLSQHGGAVGQFPFPVPFKAGTIIQVQITPVKSAVHRSDPLDLNVTANMNDVDEVRTWIKTGRMGFEWALGNANIDHSGFHVLTKTTDATLGLNFTFNWMAMGEKA